MSHTETDAFIGEGAGGIFRRSRSSEDTPGPPQKQVTHTLRPYQEQIVDLVETAVARSMRSLLVVMPTGAGKTYVAIDLIHRALAKGQQVLFFAHTRELVFQPRDRLAEAGIDAGIILAGQESDLDQPVQIASVQTLTARAIRTSRIELPPADIVFIDEAHRARAKTYQAIVKAYPDAVVIGLTATPCRGDGRGLGNVFQELIEAPQVKPLQDLGWLVPTRVYAPTTPDLKGVKVSMGDYVERQLAERMDDAKLTGDIVGHWHRLADRRRTIVYACSVGHAVHLRDEFSTSGVMAEVVTGTTPKDERDKILEKFAAGEVEVVCNYGVLTEGFDCPDAGCIILARPTKHHGLFRQMIGRGLRPAEGKVDCIVLDHAGAVFEHGFVEDPVEWTLEEDRRAEVPNHASRTMPGAVDRLTKCPECSAIRLSGKPCPVCGWTPRPKAVPVAVRDGELGRVRSDGSIDPRHTTPEERHTFHRELLYIAKQRGYKSGWCAHKYREKFGQWPARGEIEPQVPSPSTISWVRSRNIAWRKTQQKQRKAA